MKPESFRALVWAAAILLLAGLLVLSPTGAFALFLLAALCALPPAIFGSKKSRIVAALLLIAALGLAAAYYPAFEKEYKTYRKRTKEHTNKTPASGLPHDCKAQSTVLIPQS